MMNAGLTCIPCLGFEYLCTIMLGYVKIWSFSIQYHSLSKFLKQKNPAEDDYTYSLRQKLKIFEFFFISIDADEI